MNATEEEERVRIRRRRRNVRRAVVEMKRDVLQIANKLDDVIDTIAWFELTIPAASDAVASRPREAVALPTGPPPAAQNLIIAPTRSGGADISFDGKKKIHLPRTLVALMLALAAGVVPSGDELVGWIGVDELGKELERALKRKFTRQNIGQLLYRLRRILSDAGEDPRLIETSKRLGTRLRLKRNASGICAAAER